MAAYLICLTSDGGVPLFIRKRNDAKSLSFPLAAALNGIKMFGKSQGINLISTITRDARIVWHDFHDSITLIAIGMCDSLSESHLSTLIQNVFNAIVLLLGLEDVVKYQSVERLKRELHECFTLIDRLLEGFQPTENFCTFGDLALCGDVIVMPDPSNLQSHLDNFSDTLESTYGCIFLNGFIVVATKNWWSLSGDELALLSLLVGSDSTSSLRDIPIFLPKKSPKIPFRLVICQLISGMAVCLLCGTNPTLQAVETEAAKFWQPLEETLKSVSCLVPRNFPQSTAIDPSVIGFLLVNTEKQRCLSTVHPNQEELGKESRRSLHVSRRLDILRTFYRSVVGVIFPWDSSSVDEDATHQNKFTHTAVETYWCSEFHKCHAMRLGAFRIFVVYSSEIPNHTMRLITDKTLKVFMRDKAFK